MYIRYYFYYHYWHWHLFFITILHLYWCFGNKVCKTIMPIKYFETESWKKKTETERGKESERERERLREREREKSGKVIDSSRVLWVQTALFHWQNSFLMNHCPSTLHFHLTITNIFIAWTAALSTRDRHWGGEVEKRWKKTVDTPEVETERLKMAIDSAWPARTGDRPVSLPILSRSVLTCCVRWGSRSLCERLVQKSKQMHTTAHTESYKCILR